MNNACFDVRDNTLSGVLGHIELLVLKNIPSELPVLDAKGQSFVGRTRSQGAVCAQTISIGIPRGFSAGSPRIASPILATNSQVSDSPFR